MSEELRKRATAILRPLKKWHHNCHGASIRLVQNGIGTRVARGFCKGVNSQHSWVVIGDCYKPDLIIDPTLWSYRADVKGVFIGNPNVYDHTPHGAGSIWEWGRPVSGDGPAIKLTPKKPLSVFAQEFLSMVEPLDRDGWARLSSAPVEGWPAGEIFAAMDDTEELTALVPIDKIGCRAGKGVAGMIANDKHEFEPQREPFEYLCNECGMGKIAVYHTGPRFQFVNLAGHFKIIDRDSRSFDNGQIATANDEAAAQLITDALNAITATQQTKEGKQG